MAEHHYQKKRSMKAFGATDEDNCFPSGLHVLVVDDDILSLAGLERMLRQCNYNVTSSASVSQAISFVMENKGSFDIVMSEVYLPGEDGLKLLEVVGVGLGLPVVMMSANGETNVVMRCITRGACNYMIKPIRIEEVRNLWQHVLRRQYYHSVNCKDGHGDSSDNGKHADSLEFSPSTKQKQGGQVIKDLSSVKEARVNWTMQRHQQFLKAVNESGLHKVVPKRILEIMKVPGLTRENVASHLQKYRLHLKRSGGIIPEACPVASFQATGQGKSSGTMQIRQHGKTSALSRSSSSGSSPSIKAPPLRLELAGRDLDQATLKSLEQFRSHEHKQKLATANSKARVKSQLVVTDTPAPTTRSFLNIPLAQESKGGPEVPRMPPSFPFGSFQKSLQRGDGHRATHVGDLATQSYKLDFAKDMHNTKPPSAEILEENEAHSHEEIWSMDELDKIYSFFEEDLQLPNQQINGMSFPTATSNLSEEYDAIVNAEIFLCKPRPE